MSKRTCSIPDCNRTHSGKGWCQRHYMRWYRYGAPLAGTGARTHGSLAFRLKRGLAPMDENGCIPWVKGRSPKGYGLIGINAVPTLTHRLAWTLAHGPIPDGLCVLHHCDNPPCCNLDHLWLGTKADNTADMMAKGRHVSTNCILSEPDIPVIRERLSAGESRKSIGRDYGVHHATIGDIARGTSWRHV